MAAQPGPHPSAEILQAFGAGTLNEAGAAAVRAHLENCPGCFQKAAVPPELRNHPDYEVLRELGRGGMGVVYLARNKGLDRREVLKVVNQKLLDQPGAAERFRREMRSAAKLNHKNIVTAYAAPQVGELLLFAMEYVEGEDLAKLVKAKGPLAVVNACYYAQQVALGLQHAHDRGLVHRDIKPGNLILARDGKKQVVKILDFGLAKATREHQATGHDLTGTGMLLGTPQYMAPEQTLDAARADIRADIYSLGCTLYFLLTGRPPFQADSLYELLHAHQLKETAPLTELRGEVPAGLAAVVARMLAKDPARRYQQPGEVAEALAPFVKAALKPVPAGTTVSLEPKAASPRAAPVAPAPVFPQAVPAFAAPTRVIGETAIEGSDTIARGLKQAAPRPGRSSAARGLGKWYFGIGAAGLLLAGTIILWAAGVFRGKTAEAILVIKVNEPNPDLYVDGAPMTVTWRKGGKTATVRLPPGTRNVTLRKEGFVKFNEEVELQEGQRHFLTAPLVRVSRRKRKKKNGPKPEANTIVAKVKKVAGIDLVAIPAGEFYMGSRQDDKDAFDDEKPRHKVRISKPFYLGKFKVTVGQFKRFVKDTDYETEAEKAGDNRTWKKPRFDQTEEHPVVYVSWNDAVAFCQWLAKETGAKVRLPHEAEWEYSCRARSTTKGWKPTKFYFGDDEADLGEYAWYDGNSKGKTHPCGLKKPNAFGLYDMHGLAWEWCNDGKRQYPKSPKDTPELDPVGPAGASRVRRGGSWNIYPRFCRAADRGGSAPSYRGDYLGFRVLVVR
jgi:formylglycine-generating enzyme required for sulfatase activity/tRNA A-37 threonylcarbamoyl transferase component Bud32